MSSSDIHFFFVYLFIFFIYFTKIELAMIKNQKEMLTLEDYFIYLTFWDKLLFINFYFYADGKPKLSSRQIHDQKTK